MGEIALLILLGYLVGALGLLGFIAYKFSKIP